MLRQENEMLQIQLDNVTERFNLCTARTDEVKLELKMIKKLAKTQEQELMEVEEQSPDTNNYESKSEEEMNMDQYLNFDAINFPPPKNDM
ncbi:hypothetical protein HAX54_048219 [Datura stramonium]|uniref:Uncharacterized protein n=1 Tax=Datura stramonium TaxID=4076 RepID=A0ABS8STF9_DATST|nr:hypothetical protein [Datura stramonium]